MKLIFLTKKKIKIKFWNFTIFFILVSKNIDQIDNISLIVIGNQQFFKYFY